MSNVFNQSGSIAAAGAGSSRNGVQPFDSPAGYSVKQVTFPASSAVSLDVIKKQCRIEVSETYDDELLTGFLEQAYQHVQELSGVSFAQTQYELRLRCFPVDNQPIYLPFPPLQQVDAITYYDASGNAISFVDFRIADDMASQVMPVVGLNWPSNSELFTDIPDAVRITFTSGSETGSFRASQGTQAILLLIAHWYKNREETSDKNIKVIPRGVEDIIERLRPGDDFIRPDDTGVTVY